MLSDPGHNVPNLAIGMPPMGAAIVSPGDFLVRRRDPRLRTNHGP